MYSKLLTNQAISPCYRNIYHCVLVRHSIKCFSVSTIDTRVHVNGSIPITGRKVQHSLNFNHLFTLKNIHVTTACQPSSNQNQVNQDLADILKELNNG